VHASWTKHSNEEPVCRSFGSGHRLIRLLWVRKFEKRRERQSTYGRGERIVGERGYGHLNSIDFD